MSKLETSDLQTPYAKCPNCRIGDLFHESTYTWKCSTCGFSTVNPPKKAYQANSTQAGTNTPLTAEQKEALQQGREQWSSLTKLGSKSALGFAAIYCLISLALNLSVWWALEGNLSIPWAIAAWVASGSLGLVGLLLFYTGSPKKKVIFAIVLLSFVVTGRFWYASALQVAGLI